LHEIYWNLNTPALYEQIILRCEGIMAHLDSLVVRTEQHTGRSANDKLSCKSQARKKMFGGVKLTVQFPLKNLTMNMS